jgi:hypothetical protein
MPKLVIMLLCSLSMVHSTYAQDILLQHKIQQQIEQRLAHNLSIYLGHNDFIINIDVQLLLGSKKKSTQSLVDIEKDLLPGMPSYSAEGKGKSASKSYQVNIKKITAKVILNTGLETTQLDEITNIVKDTIGFKKRRRDKVSVVTTDLKINANSNIMADYFPYFFWLLISIILSVVGWFFINKIVNRTVEVNNQAGDDAHRAKEVAQSKSDTASTSQAGQQQIGALKEQIIKHILIHPHIVRNVIYNINEQEDFEILAAIYQILGKTIFNYISDNIISEDKLLKLAQRPLLSTGKKEAVFHTFYSQIIIAGQHEEIEEEQQNNPLYEIENFSPEQIAYLIAELVADKQALILAALPHSKIAAICQHLPAQNIENILISLSDIDSIDPETLKTTVESISHKIKTMPSSKTQKINHPLLYLDILHNFTTKEETSLLEHIKNDNPELHQEISKLSISFNEIAALEINDLKKLLRTISRDELALSIYNANTEFQKVIFNALVERQSKTLRVSIAKLHNPKEEEIAEARQQLVNTAKEMLYKGEIQHPT